ncbi:MAG: ferritin-like domain-containing protein [Pseudomonadota bacterium]
MNQTPSLHQCALRIITCDDPDEKIALAESVAARWRNGDLRLEGESASEPLHIPGRPDKPQLVPPPEVPRRSMQNQVGRNALIHAVTHIEFNAINLAWDAVYRFRHMPRDYYSDWISVGLDEARHFLMLRDYLRDNGCDYGDFPAHNGLWEMAVKTGHDVLVRMALVPRVLEARGLDVTPGMLKKLSAVGDTRALACLEQILDEEIGHVRIGSRWYHHCCSQRGLEHKSYFRQLVREYMTGLPKGPLNLQARLMAGFEEDELMYLQEMSE